MDMKTVSCIRKKEIDHLEVIKMRISNKMINDIKFNFTNFNHIKIIIPIFHTFFPNIYRYNLFININTKIVNL